MNHDDFSARSAKLEAWCHSPTTQSTTLEILRDVIELKKLNNGLMKPTLIDDLLCDTYAKLYEDAGPLHDQAPAPNAIPNLDGASDPAVHPAPVQLQFQPSYQPGQPAQEPHVPRPRAKGVGRRELQRKAEAAVNRPVAATVASIPARLLHGGPALALALGGRASADGADSGAGSATAAAHALAPVEVSAPASVHDSADDESGSELSELGDLDEPSPPQRPMFPGLAARIANRKASPTPGSSMVGGDSEDVGPEEKDEDEVMEDVKEE